MKNISWRHIALAISLCFTALTITAQDNDKILNRQYVDLKRIHFGFSVGTHMQDLLFTHSGYITDEGETWYMEQPNYSPGFNVTVLGDLRLGKHFNLRLSPGMYFGNKVVKMHDVAHPESEILSQNIKSAYVVAPLDLKISSERYHNIRPYVTTGVMAAFDVSKKRSDMLKLKTTDVFFTIGIGCDFYLPYFKLCPEIKYCFGLTDNLQHNRPDLSDDPTDLRFTKSLSKVKQHMLVISFYFE